MFAIAKNFAGAAAEGGEELGFTIALEGEEAGELGDTLEPEKEKSSLKVEKTFTGVTGPRALNQERQEELGQLLGSGAGKEANRIKGIKPGNDEDFTFFGTQISRPLL
jgi:NTP pyrophosphatase (non-canonical NTP hydrolase)